MVRDILILALVLGSASVATVMAVLAAGMLVVAIWGGQPSEVRRASAHAFVLVSLSLVLLLLSHIL